jgi:xylulose-5-phosphate/fructose-6-phosphate phosphoketolase
MIYVMPVPATAGRASSPTPTSKARTPRRYPAISQDEQGIKACSQFSFPGGIPSHVAPETPGSIHEGGELGYSLSHAYGAAFDNPDLIVACVVGDGEAETGPARRELALQQVPQPGPRRRGAADPAPERLQDRQPDRAGAHPATSCAALCAATARAVFVEGDDPGTGAPAHGRYAGRRARARSRDPAGRAPAAGAVARPRWPMIVLRTPRAGPGPRGRRPAGRGHLARPPGADRRCRDKPGHLKLLETGCELPADELFDAQGRLRPTWPRSPPAARAHGRQPARQRRLLLQDLRLPDFRDHAVAVHRPGGVQAEATRVLGGFLRDVMR